MWPQAKYTKKPRRTGICGEAQKKTVPAETGTAIGIPEQGNYFMMTFAISRTLLE